MSDPPPGFSGRPAVPPPPGIYSAPSEPSLGQVPMPGPRVPSTGTPHRNPLHVLLGLVAIVAVAGGAFWFLAIRDDGDDQAAPSSSTTTAGGAGSPAGGPGDVYASWVRAIVGRDWDGACALVSTSTLDEIASKGATCPDTMADAAAETRGIEGATDGDVSVQILGEAIDGDRAEVSFQLGSEPPATEPAVIVREDGTWKVDLFARGTGAGSTAAAQTMACRTEQRTVETAVEAYEAENGSPPADAEALVGRYLSEAPPNMQVDADGTVTPVGDCA